MSTTDSNIKSHRFCEQLFQGQIINCKIRYLKNNDINSAFMCGTLQYMTDKDEVKAIEYCTKQTNLAPDDIVTFNFSPDKSTLNRYANNVNKYNLHNFDNDEPDDIVMSASNRRRNKQYPVRLICISDTHNSHNKLTKELEQIYQSEADILIHCGDMTDSGTKRELKAVDKWFGALPYKHIIVTGGNMDGIGLDKADDLDSDDDRSTESIFRNAVYLEHEAFYLKEFNLQFFGSPYSMRFVGGFQINNDKQAERLWSSVPSNTDILICHGPPANILDTTSRGKHTGDAILYNHVVKRIKPKVMCFGHMHSSFGHQRHEGIHFYNCALHNVLNPRYDSNYGAYSAQTYGGYSSRSYYYSNKKSNNMDMMNKKPRVHIVDLSNLE